MCLSCHGHTQYKIDDRKMMTIRCMSTDTSGLLNKFELTFKFISHTSTAIVQTGLLGVALHTIS